MYIYLLCFNYISTICISWQMCLYFRYMNSMAFDILQTSIYFEMSRLYLNWNAKFLCDLKLYKPLWRHYADCLNVTWLVFMLKWVAVNRGGRGWVFPQQSFQMKLQIIAPILWVWLIVSQFQNRLLIICLITWLFIE